MTKQTKIISSVVIACTLLFAIAIPCFAVSFEAPSGSVLSFEQPLELLSYEFYVPDSIGVGNYVNYPCDLTINDTHYSYLRLAYMVPNGDYYISGLFLSNSIEQDADNSLVFMSSYDSSMVFSESLSVPSFEGLFNSTFYCDYTFFDFIENNETLTLNLFESEYEGNPFLDIMNMVIEALDVPIFGDFSLWDMLTTVCGLFAVVWLLKLLAGG